MNEKEKTTGGISVNTENIFPVIKKWLYSEKDIFLRELVSNATDAVTKLRRLASLGEISATDTAYRIDVTLDKDAKTLTVEDNGIGMTEEELKKYICSIALSGAVDFIQKYEGETDGAKNGIIGHFGLGFYSAFMVSDTVEIYTRSYTGAPAVHWTCSAEGEYEIEADDKESQGTEVVLHISEDEAAYLNSAKIQEMLQKYCAFMPVEIYFDDGTEKKEDAKKQPINDTTPLWQKSPADCTEEEYYTTLRRAWDMEAMIKTHAGIMDRYDPGKRVGLIVDEWGTWFDVEPGTNPGFLYQQNTMRDAMVAALNLNIFNKHSDRVHGANIAQLINVLQSLILTDGEKMLKTPTYHVFEMYKTHQDGELLQSAIASPLLEGGVPQVSESASMAADGTMTVTIANMHARRPEEISMRLDGGHYELIEARLLSGDAHDLNTFEESDAVRPRAGLQVKAAYDPMGTETLFTLPGCALALLRFRRA